MTGIPSRILIRERRPTNLIIPKPSPFDSPRIMHGQKPVNLAKDVVLTYSNPGDVVLDISAGSMTTGVACYLTGRRFIGIEKNSTHYVLGTRRLQALVNSAQRGTRRNNLEGLSFVRYYQLIQLHQSVPGNHGSWRLRPVPASAPSASRRPNGGGTAATWSGPLMSSHRSPKLYKERFPASSYVGSMNLVSVR